MDDRDSDPYPRDEPRATDRRSRAQKILSGHLSRREAKDVDLDALCAEHPQLSDELRLLFGELKGTQTLTSQAASSVPEDIGPYHLLEKIGEGGMGSVYVAEQREPVRRMVALKLIKWGVNTKEVVSRFEAERQVLSLMNHPNIARVFDGGTTAEGRPYFVMEYVSGIRLTEYCDDHRLDTRARLELFMQICRGGQHAHQKGVIHRDLKPGNILVAMQDDAPAPKIIDFPRRPPSGSLNKPCIRSSAKSSALRST